MAKSKRAKWIGPDAHIPGVGTVKRGDTFTLPAEPLGGEGTNYKTIKAAKPKARKAETAEAGPAPAEPNQEE